MTKSSNPNLRHRKRSFTIWHFLTPPMACSTRTRKLEISLFSFFWASDNSLPLGFFVGILPSHLSDYVPRNWYLAIKWCPWIMSRVAHLVSFCHAHVHHKSLTTTKCVYRAYKAGYSSCHEFFYHYNRTFVCRNLVGRSMGLSVPSRSKSWHCSVRYFILRWFLSGNSPMVLSVLSRISDKRCTHLLHCGCFMP